MELNATNEEYESIGDIIKSIEDSMKNLMKETYKAPQDLMEHWAAFSSAINWNEDFLKYLLAFHVSILLFFILTRNNFNAQMILFFLITILVFLSEYVNTWGAEKWRSFSSQNYFDKSGAFIGIFYAAPLLLICTFQLINFLIISSSTMIKLKRMQFARQRAAREKAEKEDTSVAATNKTDKVE